MLKRIFLISMFLIFAEFVRAFDLPFFYAGPRAEAMAGAFTAIADDENAICINPAGMATNRNDKIVINGRIFSYNFRNDSGVKENYSNNGIGSSVVWGNLGLRIFYNSIGDNLSVSSVGDFMEEGCKITGAFGYNVLQGLSAGVSVNVFAQTDVSGGVGFDAGVLYAFNKNLSAGAVVVNAVSSGSFLVVDDYGFVRATEHPIFVNAGVSASPFEGVLISFEVKNIFEAGSLYRDEGGVIIKHIYRRSFHVGSECVFSKWSTLRAGVKGGEITYDYGPDAGKNKMRFTLSAGAALKADFFSADISVSDDFREFFGVKAPPRFDFSLSGSF